MDELSVITEVSESGHSTHTTFRSSSGGEEGEAAEEPVASKREVGGEWGVEIVRAVMQGHRSIVSHKVHTTLQCMTMSPL